jgi:predicted metalloprotease with PDZ domain
LLLRRAGLIDDATYLRLITKIINQVLQTPGRAVQTVAQSSFDAWVKYYRQDENTPNATVSYYTKGCLVALCLDLTLRKEGKTTLDEVMRALWARTNGGPMTEADLRDVLQQMSGRSFNAELERWVHSTDDLPLADLLATHGVTLQAQPPQLAQRLGLRVTENHGVQIKSVLRGGIAERAGMAPGDEWLGIDVQKQGWRISKLDDVVFYAGKETTLEALIARDGRLLRLPLSLTDRTTTEASTTHPPKKARSSASAVAPVSDTMGLVTNDPAKLAGWLAGVRIAPHHTIAPCCPPRPIGVGYIPSAVTRTTTQEPS